MKTKISNKDIPNTDCPSNETNKSKRTSMTWKQFGNKCQGFHTQDCGICVHCLDKKIYGGHKNEDKNMPNRGPPN